MAKSKKIPTGENVSAPLRKQIISLLRTHAGADNAALFNYTLTILASNSNFLQYTDEDPCVLFGMSGSDEASDNYYPMCMYAYYGKHRYNKAMFKYKDEAIISIASDKIPTATEVMGWFYERHKDELIGLI